MAVPAEDEIVCEVQVVVDEYVGPFLPDVLGYPQDFDEAHHLLGLTRTLYDDVMAWHGLYIDPRDRTQIRWQRPSDPTHHELLRRLRHEVHPGITVLPRIPGEPDTVVRLRTLRSESPGQLTIWRDGPTRPMAVRDLPPVPTELGDLVIRWAAAMPSPRADRRRTHDAEGEFLAEQLKAAIGDSYEVISS